MLIALTPNSGLAQIARIELHSLQSVTITDREFLSGDGGGVAVTIAAELRIPKSDSLQVPAIVLLHGSSGVSGREDGWVRLLNDMGIATLLVDSFTGRGIVNTVSDQSQLGRLAMIPDAYRGLELLARHQGIDPARIGVMGFSRGGQAALYSSMRRFQRRYLASPNLEFAAYIVFYAPCNTRYVDDENLADKPIRIFQGSVDEFVAVEPSRAYVERLRRAGKDVQLAVYEGAGHLFDSPILKTPLRLPQAQLIRRCRLEEGSDGAIVNSETRQPFNYSDSCVDVGTTVTYRQSAHRKAQADVRHFLARVFKLR